MNLYPVYILIVLVITLVFITFYLIRKKKNIIQKFEEDRKGYRVLLEEIINSGGINITDNFGNTPLILSVRFAFDDIFNQIIDQTTNLNASDAKGYTATHFAAALDNIKALKSLVNSGANLNALANNRDTPIMLAVKAKALDAVGYLIAQKVNLTDYNDQQQTVAQLMDKCWFTDTKKDTKQAQKEELREELREELKFQTLPQ